MRGLFAGTGIALEFSRRTVDFRNDSPEAFVDFMATQYGPLVKARELLDAGRPLGRAARRPGRAQRGDGHRPPGDFRVAERVPGRGRPGRGLGSHGDLVAGRHRAGPRRRNVDARPLDGVPP